MGGGIVHSGVGMGVAIIARVTTIDTCHKDGAVEERGVIEGVLLVHESLLDLRRELADRLGREAAAIAVGDIVAGGPTDIVEVGDMAGRGGAGESGYLFVVAHNEKECGGGIGGRGVGILTLNERGDGSGGSAYSG